MTIDESARNPIEELAEEFADRYRNGERPSVDDYAARYPQWAEQIRSLFPALVVMERVRPDPFSDNNPHMDSAHGARP